MQPNAAVHALILSAGYATRMYPLTANTPKSLLPVGDRVVLDWMMDALQSLPMVEHIALVTNAKFAPHFTQWVAERRFHTHIALINDGSTHDANRVGAIGDIALAIRQLRITEPLLVSAGDHIVEWDLAQFIAFGQAHAPHATIALYRLPDIREASKFGMVEVDAEQRVIHCEEKPAQPRSNLAMIALYYLPPAIFPRLQAYLASQQNTDAPGHFIVWLSRLEPVYGWASSGRYCDIGSLESYRATCASIGDLE